MRAFARVVYQSFISRLSIMKNYILCLLILKYTNMWHTNIINIFIFVPLRKYFGSLDVRSGGYVCERKSPHISAAREKSRISYRSRFSRPSFFCFRYHKRGFVSTLPRPGRARRRLDDVGGGGKEVAKRAREQRLRNGHAARYRVGLHPLPRRPERSEFLPWRYANTRKTRNDRTRRIVWRDARRAFAYEYLHGSVGDRTERKLRDIDNSIPNAPLRRVVAAALPVIPVCRPRE